MTKPAVVQQNLRRVWSNKKSQLGLTQVKLSTLLGMKQPTVSQYLNGVIPLNTDIILEFARILQVNPREIDPDIPLAATPTIRVPILNSSQYADVPAEYEGCVVYLVTKNDEALHGPYILENDQLILYPLNTRGSKGKIVLHIDNEKNITVGRNSSNPYELMSLGTKESQEINPNGKFFEVKKVLRDLI